MKILLFIGLLFIVSCEKDPLSINKSDNPQIPVSILFNYDGCKVYSFQDEGRRHYFTNCTEAIGTKLEACGKNCLRARDESIVNR